MSAIAAWEKFLFGAEKLPATEKSEIPVLPGVAAIILNRLEKIIEKGLAVKTSSPDPVLHKVRIQCKKLRYLLDFFCSEFPGGKVSKVLRDLKKIQDALGDFNDSVDSPILTQEAGYVLWSPAAMAATNSAAVLFNLSGLLAPARMTSEISPWSSSPTT